MEKCAIMKTKSNDGRTSVEAKKDATEEIYLKACADEDLSFYDLKLIKEHFLECKEADEMKMNKTVISIPQLTVSYNSGWFESI